MSDIFISYKREDEAHAKLLAESLERIGWTIWWDSHLRAGEHFDNIIEHEIQTAKCVIVIWSHRSVRSQYVKDEATLALSLKKLIPVVIDDVSLPFRFSGLHTLNFSDWKGAGEDPMFRNLTAAVEGYAKRTSAGNSSVSKIKGADPRHSTSSVTNLSKESSEEAEDISAFGFTAIYGQGFKETKVPDIYLFRVYVNLLGGSGDADTRANEESGQFASSKGYSTFTVINRRHNFFLGYYEYTVQFKW